MSFLDFLKVLFFLVGYAILKDFSYLFGAKCTGRKFYRWRHDNWSIGQSVIFHAAPDTALSILFFFPWIYNDSNPFRQNKSTSRLRRSLRDFMHWSWLPSLLRTCERPTCSKSKYFQPFVLRRLVIAPVRYTKKLHFVNLLLSNIIITLKN